MIPLIQNQRPHLADPAGKGRRARPAFPPAITYGGFFPDEASMLVLVNKQMPMMPASDSALVVGPHATPLVGYLPTSRIIPPWGKGDTLLIARAKKGSEHTPEEHMILLCALKHKKAQARASKPAPFVIPGGIMKELTSMMQTWLMKEAACPPAVRQEEPNNTLNLLDIDFWLWY